MAKMTDSLSNIGYLTTDDEDERLAAAVKKLVLFCTYTTVIGSYVPGVIVAPI